MDHPTQPGQADPGSPVDTLLSLPSDILISLLSALPLSDALRLLATCSGLQLYAKVGLLWRNHYNQLRARGLYLIDGVEKDRLWDDVAALQKVVLRPYRFESVLKREAFSSSFEHKIYTLDDEWTINDLCSQRITPGGRFIVNFASKDSKTFLCVWDILRADEGDTGVELKPIAYIKTQRCPDEDFLIKLDEGRPGLRFYIFWNDARHRGDRTTFNVAKFGVFTTGEESLERVCSILNREHFGFQYRLITVAGCYAYVNLEDHPPRQLINWKTGSSSMFELPEIQGKATLTIFHITPEGLWCWNKTYGCVSLYGPLPMFSEIDADRSPLILSELPGTKTDFFASIYSDGPPPPTLFSRSTSLLIPTWELGGLPALLVLTPQRISCFQFGKGVAHFEHDWIKPHPYKLQSNLCGWTASRNLVLIFQLGGFSIQNTFQQLQFINLQDQSDDKTYEFYPDNIDCFDAASGMIVTRAVWHDQSKIWIWRTK